MRNYKEETEKRVAFIRQVLAESGCRGIVFGNSGGKDCALVGILISIVISTPVGSTIVAADILAFAGFYAAGKLRGGVRA